jgi:hypothetical protein
LEPCGRGARVPGPRGRGRLSADRAGEGVGAAAGAGCRGSRGREPAPTARAGKPRRFWWTQARVRPSAAPCANADSPNAAAGPAGWRAASCFNPHWQGDRPAAPARNRPPDPPPGQPAPNAGSGEARLYELHRRRRVPLARQGLLLCVVERVQPPPLDGAQQGGGEVGVLVQDLLPLLLAGAGGGWLAGLGAVSGRRRRSPHGAARAACPLRGAAPPFALAAKPTRARPAIGRGWPRRGGGRGGAKKRLRRSLVTKRRQRARHK